MVVEHVSEETREDEGTVPVVLGGPEDDLAGYICHRLRHLEATAKHVYATSPQRDRFSPAEASVGEHQGQGVGRLLSSIKGDRQFRRASGCGLRGTRRPPAYRRADRSSSYPLGMIPATARSRSGDQEHQPLCRSSPWRGQIQDGNRLQGASAGIVVGIVVLSAMVHW